MAGVHIALAVRGAERNALREFEPFGQREIRLQLAAETLAVRVEQHSLGLVVGERQYRLDLVAASRNRGCIVLFRSRPENLVQPVRAGHVAEREKLGIHRRRKRLAARVVIDGLLPYHVELLGIQQTGKARNLLDAVRNVDIHANLAALGPLRRNQHNAARTYRSTVDSGRSGILENRHRLDVVGHKRCVGHSVHDEQHAVARCRAVVAAVRTLVIAFRTASADRVRRLFHRVARLLDRNTRHAALEDGRQVAGTALRHVVQLDCRHGHRKIFLALRTVTDGHNLTDHHRVVLQDDIDLGAVHHGQALRLAAYIGEIEGGSAFHRNLVAALGIGCHAVGRTFFYDRGAYERLFGGARHASRDRDPFLRPRRENE